MIENPVKHGTNIRWTHGTRFKGETLNVVIGCSKVSPGCAYCLHPDTPILYADMAWRPIGDVKIGDILVGFDEYPEYGKERKLRPTIVENIWWYKKEATRIITETTEIITTDEHKWLTGSSNRWSETKNLHIGTPLRKLGDVVEFPNTDDFMRGYIKGMTVGDGTFRFDRSWRSDKSGYPQMYWRVALTDEEALGRLILFLSNFGVESHIKPFGKGDISTHHKPLNKVEIRAKDKLITLESLLLEHADSDEFGRGYVSGFFDAEGSYNRNLRVHQKDIAPLVTFNNYARRFGFNFQLEKFDNRIYSSRLVGSVEDKIRFFSTFRPAITRKTNDLWGRAVGINPDRLVQREKAGLTDVVDIQTSTHTFYANGIATHNCYAETLSMQPKMSKFGYTGLPWTPENAEQNVKLMPQRLEKMLHWSKPRMVFLNSMSDTFHELVPEEYIRDIYRHMAATPDHIYQVLTKRPERMAQIVNKFGYENDFKDVYGNTVTFPLPNVWHGTTTENQYWADKRIPHLLNTPSVVHFLSMEPLLGPVSLKQWLTHPWVCEFCFKEVRGDQDLPSDWDLIFQSAICPECLERGVGIRMHGGQFATRPDPRPWKPELDWIIVGGESGVHMSTERGRWMNLDWARNLRDECTDGRIHSRVPFFYKQSSAVRSEQGKELDGVRWEQMPLNIGGVD